MGHSVSVTGTSPVTIVAWPVSGVMISQTLKLTQGIKRTELRNKQTGMCAMSIVLKYT